MKEVKSNFTDTQRKALLDFVRVYGDAYDRARDAYRSARVSLTDSMIREEAGRKGWLPAINGLADLKENLTHAEAEVAKYGVTLDEEGHAEFVSGSTSPLRLYLASKISEKIGDESDVRQSFADAQAKLLTVESAEEAAKIVEPLINFAVKVN
jgi:hypothetical protein